MKRHVGHPARQSRELKRRKRQETFDQPDAGEQRVQEMNRRMRQAIHEAPTEAGAVTGPLTVAAEHLVVQLQAAHNLEGEVHHTAIIEYLVGCWGEIAHAFPETPDLPGYVEWRERSRDRVIAALPSVNLT